MSLLKVLPVVYILSSFMANAESQQILTDKKITKIHIPKPLQDAGFSWN
ncbi:hypothetical protein [Pseudoalteromonas sp. NBT06-2]|nr:hypothetical protein [Pseudoalteromonas sp. NBT06-2]